MANPETVMSAHLRRAAAEPSIAAMRDGPVFVAALLMASADLIDSLVAQMVHLRMYGPAPTIIIAPAGSSPEKILADFNARRTPAES